jgi:hypothetical protein
MDEIVLDVAKGLATNSSRRGFLARTGYFLFALVGSGALLQLVASPALARDSYPSQASLSELDEATFDAVMTAAGCCFHWYSCCSPFCWSCGQKIVRVYDCPCNCSGSHCTLRYYCGRYYCD